MDWDSQQPRRLKDELLYEDENGNVWKASQLTFRERSAAEFRDDLTEAQSAAQEGIDQESEEVGQAVPRHRAVLSRPWETNTFAVLEWSSATVTDADELLEAVMATLQVWVATEGEPGFYDDYNVGDLAGYLGDDALQVALQEENVWHLSVETFSDLTHSEWRFDTHLLPGEEAH